ncbi:hypothetical protein U3516DRAFT_635507 [Neocallimastix sp. 'constans']
MHNLLRLISFTIVYGLIIICTKANDVIFDSECLVQNELYINENDKIEFSFTIENASSKLNVTFMSNNSDQFNIEPQNIIIDNNQTPNINNNMTLYGYNYGSSTLHLNIKPIDEGDQKEINKTIKVNVLHSEKKLFDSLLIAFTVFFLFFVGTGMPLATVIKSLKVNKAKPLIAGILSQIIIVPLIAYGLSKIFQLNDISSYSVMMIASSPGSLYATILVYYIGGDKPLSICLCLISTLLSTITFPLIMALSGLINNINLSNFIPIWQTLSASFMQLIPISIGWIVAYYFPIVSMYSSKLLPLVGALALLTTIISSFLKMGTSFLEQWEVYVISISISLVSYSLGWILSKLIKLNPFQCRSVCFHVGMQNTTIPIAIIQVSTGCLSPFLSIFPAHYSVYNMIIGIIIFLIFLFFFSVVETVVEDSEIIEYRKSLENQLAEVEHKTENPNNRMISVISNISIINDSSSEKSTETNESLKKAKINI